MSYPLLVALAKYMHVAVHQRREANRDQILFTFGPKDENDQRV